VLSSATTALFTWVAGLLVAIQMSDKLAWWAGVVGLAGSASYLCVMSWKRTRAALKDRLPCPFCRQTITRQVTVSVCCLANSADFACSNNENPACYRGRVNLYLPARISRHLT
jgi:hypothetical protein